MVTGSAAECAVNSPFKVLPSIFVTAGIFSWFFLVTVYFGKLFENVVSDPFWIFVSELFFFGVGALLAIIGGAAKFSRRRILWFSLILGVIATGALAVVHGAAFAVIIGSILGLSFGIGFPSSVALFADRTKSENRGKYSGLLVLITFLLISIGTIAIEVFQVGFLSLIVLTVVLRLTSLLTLIMDPCDKAKLKDVTWKSIFTERTIVLYLLSWIIFNLVSGFSNFIYPALPKTTEYADAVGIGNLFQFVAVAALSVPSGLICDRIGRRPPIIFGTIMFSISFAILAIAPTPFVVVLQETTFGVAWGFCMVAYFAIPGDLAKGRSQEKLYAINLILPFIFYMIAGTLPLNMNQGIPVNIISPILSILLLVSIIPIFYATETLPQSTINERKMRKHLEQLEKAIVESKKEA
jgi:MFS family permease